MPEVPNHPILFPNKRLYKHRIVGDAAAWRSVAQPIKALANLLVRPPQKTPLEKDGRPLEDQDKRSMPNSDGSS